MNKTIVKVTHLVRLAAIGTAATSLSLVSTVPPSFAAELVPTCVSARRTTRSLNQIVTVTNNCSTPQRAYGIWASGIIRNGNWVSATNCVIRNNYQQLATNFISRCRKGTIRREFPGEYLEVSLAEIIKQTQTKNKNAKKAWKLLNDSRFKKEAKGTA